MRLSKSISLYHRCLFKTCVIRGFCSVPFGFYLNLLDGSCCPRCLLLNTREALRGASLRLLLSFFEQISIRAACVSSCKSFTQQCFTNLVDPASSHMLVSKIKPCMSQYKLLHGETANGSLKQLSFIWWSFITWITMVILELIHAS